MRENKQGHDALLLLDNLKKDKKELKKWKQVGQLPPSLLQHREDQNYSVRLWLPEGHHEH